MLDHITRPGRVPAVVPALVLGAAWLATPPVAAQVDICGCAGAQSLGDFRSVDAATWPPGTTISAPTITIPLPPGGVMVFDSFTVDGYPASPTANATVVFSPDAANSPVTMLVKGDVVIDANDTVQVSGAAGGGGTTGLNGVGGAGGPGGFRGGDGAYQLVNLADDGGPGFGPAGGAGGVSDGSLAGAPGGFVGNIELLPAIGGSGGGGGASPDVVSGCSAGGGGGGGGVLLLAANGTVEIAGNVRANGGAGGGRYSGLVCAGAGAGGAGGAIRILADRLVGNGAVSATGGVNGSVVAADGAIRLEAFTNETAASIATPVAVRAPAPGPLAPPLAQSVAITALQGESLSRANGQPIATLPQGAFGAVDVLFDVPGIVDVDLETIGVPVGTGVEVTIKPRLGRNIIRRTTTLDPAQCDVDGRCTATVSIDIPAGQHLVEARATFQQ
ncbi:MAG: hypothetical protein H6983_01445 [Ectothiorhodospiraceae bacterium]|nr:hypothetical protein [Ectothiorhodospiraceae bacterium]